MKIKQSYITSLETSSVETVHGILDAKLEATSPESLVDYIGFSVGNIEDAIAKMDKATAELKAMKDNAKAQIEMIKAQSAQWLSDTGISKLNGLRVSSITINTPSPSYEVKIFSEDWFLKQNEFTKTTLDKTAIKNFLLETEIDYSEYAQIEVTHKANQIKINKKRG